MSGSPLPVVINRSGGTAGALGARLETELREAFAGAGMAIDLVLAEGEQIAAALERFAGAPVVAVGGGDGTLGQAAGVLAAQGSALGVLPLGTRNHFARQLDIPLDLAGAARVIAGGRRQRVDLARAGERSWINNASVGLYARLVAAREAGTGPKWLATFPAALHVLRHLEQRRLVLALDGDKQVVKTPLLFVGNNRYALDGGRIGTRESLSEGCLAVYALAPKSAGQLVWFAVRALTGRADPARDFAALADARRLTIAGAGTIRVALDGEVMRLPLPLELTIEPGGLEVIVP